MGFKMNPPDFNNSDQNDVTSNNVIRSDEIIKKDLDDGIIAEANKDGTTFIDKDINLDSEKARLAIAHEQVHHDQMQRGDLDYNDDFVFWKGETWPREDMNEGSKQLPWEKEAYNKQDEVFNHMFTKHA